MNFRSSDVEAYQKILPALKLHPTVDVQRKVMYKQILLLNQIPKYYLPRALAPIVIEGLHLTYIHIGTYGITN